MMVPDRDEVYVEWLAAAPKGVRWDKAQEMYAMYQERRKEQAAAVATRLLGKTGNHTSMGDGTYRRRRKVRGRGCPPLLF